VRSAAAEDIDGFVLCGFVLCGVVLSLADSYNLKRFLSFLLEMAIQTDVVFST